MSEDKKKKEEEEVVELFEKHLPKVQLPPEVAKEVKEKVLEEVKKTSKK